MSRESLAAISAMLFLAVYLAGMAAVFRALRDPARWAAVPAIFAVVIIFACGGWALAGPAVAAAVVLGRRPCG